MHQAKINNLIRGAKFPNRHLKKIEDQSFLESKWLEKLKEAIAEIRKANSVIILGDPGTGKTQMSVCIGKMLCENLEKVIYIKASDLYGKARESLHNWNEQKEISNFVSPYLLIIDEAGKTKMSDYEKRTLFTVFDKRYDCCKPTIIISNQTKRSFADSIDPALADRFCESAFVIEPSWPSFRKRGNNEG